MPGGEDERGSGLAVDGGEQCSVAIESNNVETDERGDLYVVDRGNAGMHIPELTGEARRIAGQP